MTIPLDKKLHLGAGFIIALVTGIILTPLFGLLLAVGTGVGKEVYDRLSGKGTPEIMDIVYTVAGGLLAAGLMVVLH